MTCQQAKSYCKRVLIAIDQLCNAVIGGSPDETMSSRVWRNSLKGYWYAKVGVKILDAVFSLFGDKDHCRVSYENEMTRKQLGAWAR